MTAREKLAAALILPGMLLLCAEQLPAAIAGITLLGAGAVALNWKTIRKSVMAWNRGATCSRQPKPGAEQSAAANWLPGHRAKKKAARTSRKRHRKNYSILSYQKKEGLSIDGAGNHPVV